MNNCIKDWIDISQGILVPLVAVLAVFIAWQQWRTNKLRLDHELFDRRFSLYEIVLNLFGEVLRKSGTKSIDILSFLEATKSAAFLFDSKIQQFMTDTISKYSDLETIEAELEGMLVGEERSSLVHKRREIRDWFHDELLVMDVRFRKHLSLVPTPIAQRITNSSRGLSNLSRLLQKKPQKPRQL